MSSFCLLRKIFSMEIQICSYIYFFLISQRFYIDIADGKNQQSTCFLIFYKLL